MARRTTMFWTNAQYKVLTEKANELGLEAPHELLAIVGLKLAGVEVKQTPKARRKAVEKQKELTMKEYEGKEPDTVKKIRKILEDEGRPMTVDEVRIALGWTAPFRLHSVMHEYFVNKGLREKTGPGRRPILWGLK